MLGRQTAASCLGLPAGRFGSNEWEFCTLHFYSRDYRSILEGGASGDAGHLVTGHQIRAEPRLE